MSFLTAQPDELAAAAGKLQTVGAQQVAQNAAAVAPTTGVIPAAADDVSALQASLFTAYGTLYQQVSGEAAALYDAFVNTLQLSAGSYAATEAANSSAAASSLSPSAMSQSALSPAAAVPSALTDSPLASLANIVNIGVGNWASAASNFLGLANGGLLLPLDDSAAAAAAAEGAGAGSAVTAGLTGAPAAAAVGGASSIGALSAPPAWTATFASSTAPVGSGWTAAATPTPAVGTTLLPGMPGMAATSRNSAGFGAPRYGVKPIVMAKGL